VATGSGATTANTAHAYQLLQQKQFAAAAKEAKGFPAQFPNDSEAWKIAGFAELNLKQYPAAIEDPSERQLICRRFRSRRIRTLPTPLGQAYVLSEKYDRALPFPDCCDHPSHRHT
jgi:hypothetical protein